MNDLIGPRETTAGWAFSVKFSVILAFWYQDRHQVIQKIAKISNMAIYFRETNLAALWTNVDYRSDLGVTHVVWKY